MTRRALPPLVAAAALAALAHPAFAAALLGGRAMEGGRLLALALSQAGLVAMGALPAALVGIALGVAVTRRWGAPLRPTVDALGALAQATPPVVAVALALPAFGFGAGPTALALALYALLPVLRATAGALEAGSPEAREAAQAVGLTPFQALREVELPLAFPAIAEALRVALLLTVATAAVGSLAGAATLGLPIVLGLQNQNATLILQGAAATAALAFALDGLLIAALGRLPRLA